MNETRFNANPLFAPKCSQLTINRIKLYCNFRVAEFSLPESELVCDYPFTIYDDKFEKVVDVCKLPSSRVSAGRGLRSSRDHQNLKPKLAGAKYMCLSEADQPVLFSQS